MNKKNRLELRLDPDSQELLDSIKARTGLTKTSIIKSALKVYAANLNNGHIYTVRLNSAQVKEMEQDEKELEENIRIAKTQWLNDD